MNSKTKIFLLLIWKESEMSEKIYCIYCKKSLSGDEMLLGWHYECKKLMDQTSINYNIEYPDYYERLKFGDYKKLENILRILNPYKIIDQFDLLQLHSVDYDNWERKKIDLKYHKEKKFVIIVYMNGYDEQDYDVDSPEVTFEIENFQFKSLLFYKQTFDVTNKILAFLKGNEFKSIRIDFDYLPSFPEQLKNIIIINKLSLIYLGSQDILNFEFDCSDLKYFETLKVLEIFMTFSKYKLKNILNNTITQFSTNSEVTEDFTKLKNLEFLDLKNSISAPNQLINLNNISHIKKLKINLRNHLKGGMDSIIGSKTNIEELHVYISGIEQTSIISSCPKLKKLHISTSEDQKLIEYVFNEISNLEFLEEIIIEMNDILAQFFFHNPNFRLKSFTKLKKVTLVNNVIFIPDFLKLCTNLEFLKLKGAKSNVNTQNLEVIKDLKNLKLLYINKNLQIQENYKDLILDMKKKEIRLIL